MKPSFFFDVVVVGMMMMMATVECLTVLNQCGYYAQDGETYVLNQDMILDGTSRNSYVACIYLGGVGQTFDGQGFSMICNPAPAGCPRGIDVHEGTTVKNINLKGFSNGVTSTGFQGNVFSNIHIDNAGYVFHGSSDSYGLNMHSPGGIVQGCTVQNFQTAGSYVVGIYAFVGTTITSNVVKNLNTNFVAYGIYSYLDATATISNNIIDGITSDGYTNGGIYNGGRAQLLANTISNLQGQARNIYAINSVGTTIQKNTISAVAGTAIQITDNQAAAVINNIVDASSVRKTNVLYDSRPYTCATTAYLCYPPTQDSHCTQDCINGAGTSTACTATCAHGTCSASGTCTCSAGFAGTNCDTCAAGFAGANCDRCATGYAGASCNQCASGYSGYPKCITCSADATCSGNGHCAADGSVSCSCNAGFAGANCDQCAAGYLNYPICYLALPAGSDYIFNKAAFISGALRVLDSNNAGGRGALANIASVDSSELQFSGQMITGVGSQSGKCLDVWGNNIQVGTTVGMFKCNAGSNQKWTYTTTGAWAYIQPVGSKTLCLAPTGGKTDAGTLLTLQKCTGDDSQLWSITPTSPPAVPVTISINVVSPSATVTSVYISSLANQYATQFGVPVGYINIASQTQAGSQDSKILTVSFNANVGVYSATQTASIIQQQVSNAVAKITGSTVPTTVTVTRIAPTISSSLNYLFNKGAHDTYSLLVLDTNAAYTSTLQPPSDQTSSRLFTFSGTAIKTSTGLCLDVYKNSNSAGSAVGVFKCGGQSNQMWIFGTTGQWTTISPASNPLLCLAPSTKTTLPMSGSSVTLQTCNGSPYQMWLRSADAPAF